MRHSAPALVLLLLMTLTLTTVFGTMVYFFEGGVFKVSHMPDIIKRRKRESQRNANESHFK